MNQEIISFIDSTVGVLKKVLPEAEVYSVIELNHVIFVVEIEINGKITKFANRHSLYNFVFDDIERVKDLFSKNILSTIKFKDRDCE